MKDQTGGGPLFNVRLTIGWSVGSAENQNSTCLVGHLRVSMASSCVDHLLD